MNRIQVNQWKPLATPFRFTCPLILSPKIFSIVLLDFMLYKIVDLCVTSRWPLFSCQKILTLYDLTFNITYWCKGPNNATGVQWQTKITDEVTWTIHLAHLTTTSPSIHVYDRMCNKCLCLPFPIFIGFSLVFFLISVCFFVHGWFIVC